MAIQNARILIRRGNEVDFDANNMQPGEWALSTDEKIVRICVSPGVCIRMATYDAFEADMAQIEAILEECETIEEAVKQIQSEIDAKEIVIEKYVQDAKTYSETASDEADRATLEADRAKSEADRASSIANIGIATTEKTGIVKPDGTTITVDADGTIHSVGGGGTAGTTDYEELENKPQINGVELSGNKSFEELGFDGIKDYSVLENKPSINGTELKGNKSLSDLGIASSTDLQKVETKVDTILEKGGLTFDESASGENIHLTDTTDNNVTAFALYGKATQDGTPTPDLPVEIDISGASGSVEVSTLSEDGTKSTTATISTPNGLPGIPVSSGGNYTDENGQQWISDSIVKYADSTGKYAQRVKKRVLNGSETWYSSSVSSVFYMDIRDAKIELMPVICDMYISTILSNANSPDKSIKHGVSSVQSPLLYIKDSSYKTVDELKTALGTKNVTVYYALAEPIIADLSAEEIAEIEKLQTFYPVTNISNDAGCGMEIAYKADLKNYVDNIILARVETLETAVINNL